VVTALIHPPGYGEKAADHIFSVYEKFRKPIVVVSFGGSAQSKALEEKLRGHLVVVNTPRRAAKALSAVAFYGSEVYHSSYEGWYKHKGG
jgi:acyl-CoA synthetase (NDP forming)